GFVQLQRSENPLTGQAAKAGISEEALVLPGGIEPVMGLSHPAGRATASTTLSCMARKESKK
ncbi:MAG: hypothetical protein AB1700_19490, partial [Bacillota bacterium]